MTTTTNNVELPGFTQADFNVFQLQGLDERMAAIQQRIQPKFQAIGRQLSVEVAVQAGNEMFLHVAKHARRKVNPPKDTWLAICDNKRGYKSHPHFQLGLFDDHLFLWLAFIYELPNKKRIAAAFLDQIDDVIAAVPKDYVLSMDHMKKDAAVVGEMTKKDWGDTLVRFRDVQKAELLIGRHIQADDSLLRDGEALLQYASTTFETLMPLYRMAEAYR